MLKAHKFHVKFTVHTIMSEGGDVTMEEDYTLSYRTEEIPGFSLIYQLVCLHLQCQSS